MPKWFSRRARTWLWVGTAGLCVWILTGSPPVDVAAQSNVGGGAPTRSDVDVRPVRLRFEPVSKRDYLGGRR